MLQNGDNDVLEDPSIVAISSCDLNKKKGADEDITSGMVKLSLKKNIGTRRIKTYLGHLSVPFVLIVFLLLVAPLLKQSATYLVCTACFCM